MLETDRANQHLQLSLDDVLITDELARRPSRAPDYAAENRALVQLAEALTQSPDTVLQTLVELVLDLCRADSAGISLLEQDGDSGIFRWNAVAGAFAANIGGTMLREASPCGTVLARNDILLFHQPERYFRGLAGAEPAIVENLLAPFHLDGKPAGTVWVIGHSADRQFDAEDARVLRSLSRFASAAYQLMNDRADRNAAATFQQQLEKVNQSLQRVVDEGEERYRTLFNSIDEGFYLADVVFDQDEQPVDILYLDENPAAVHMTGQSFVGRRLSHINPNYEPFWYEIFGRVAKSGRAERLQRYSGPDDTWFDFYVFRPVEERDNRIAVIFQDITERKRAEEALRESEERRLLAVEAAVVGDWTFDVATGILECSSRVREMHRMKAEGPIDLDEHDRLIHPEDRATVQAAREAALDPAVKGHYHAEFRFLFDDGEIRWFESVGQAVFEDSDGERQARLLLGVMIDITERKSIETALRESENHLTAELEAMQQLHELVTRLVRSPDLSTALEEVLVAAIDLTNAARGTVQLLDPRTNVLQFVAHRGFTQEFLESYREVRSGSNTACGRVMQTGKRVVIRDVHSEPSYAQYRETATAAGYRGVQSTPLMSRDGTLLGMLSTHYADPYCPSERDLRLFDLYARQAADVIERVQSADTLRNSEERFRTVANLVPDLLWRNDASGTTDWCNQRWYDYTGQTRDSALGFGWLDVIHPDDRDTCVARFREAIQSGTPFQNEYRIRQVDGEYRWFLARAEPVRDDTGAIVNWFGTATDIHDQLTVREELERRVEAATSELRAISRRLLDVQEAERRYLASELHDEIGQSLTGLNFALAMARRGETNMHLDQAADITDDLLARVRQLSLDLRPSVLDDLGLLPALTAHIGRFTELTGVHVEMSHQGLERRFPCEVETTAYRVIQEALTNIARHAGVNTASVQILGNSKLLIWVSDAGHGFDVDACSNAGRSSGLAGIRERVRLAGGTVTIESAPGEGTTIVAELPIDPLDPPAFGGRP